MLTMMATVLLTGCTASDGDSLRCGSERIRLLAIDAPEIGRCQPAGRQCAPGDPVASRDNLRRMIAGRPLSIERVKQDRYGRTIARVAVNGRDLSCSQIRGGFAIYRRDWDDGGRIGRICS